jgi:hypothetical protein
MVGNVSGSMCSPSWLCMFMSYVESIEHPHLSKVNDVAVGVGIAACMFAQQEMLHDNGREQISGAIGGSMMLWTR